MIRNAKVTILTLAVISTAGCAHSGYMTSRVDRPKWKSAKDCASTKLSELQEPAVLPETHFAAAALHEQQGLVGKAIRQYRKAIVLNHQYIEAYNRLGVLLNKIGRPDEAVGVLSQAVKLEPDNAILRNNLGFAFVLQARWKQAERELTRATELKPYFARAHVNLGMVLSKQGRFDDALASFQAVLPETDAYYNLGLMFHGQGRHEEAAEAFEHVLSINPSFMAATTQLEQVREHLAPPPEPAVVEVAASEAPVAEAAIDEPQTPLPPAEQQAVEQQTVQQAQPGEWIPEEGPTVSEEPVERITEAMEVIPDETEAIEEQPSVVTVDDLFAFDEYGNPCVEEFDEETLEAVLSFELDGVPEPVTSPQREDAGAEAISAPEEPAAIASLQEPFSFDEDGFPCDEGEFFQPEPAIVVYADTEQGVEGVAAEPAGPPDTAIGEESISSVETSERAEPIDFSDTDWASTDQEVVAEGPVVASTPRVNPIDWEAVFAEAGEMLLPALEDLDPCLPGREEEPPVTLARLDDSGLAGPPTPRQIALMGRFTPFPGETIQQGAIQESTIVAGAVVSNKPVADARIAHRPAEKASTAVSSRPIGRRARLRELATQLADVRAEIDCWEQAVVEQGTHLWIDVCFADDSTLEEGLWSAFGDQMEAITSVPQPGDQETGTQQAGERGDTTSGRRETMSMTIVPPKKKATGKGAPASEDGPTPRYRSREAKPNRDNRADAGNQFGLLTWNEIPAEWQVASDMLFEVLSTAAEEYACWEELEWQRLAAGLGDSWHEEDEVSTPKPPAPGDAGADQAVLPPTGEFLHPADQDSAPSPWRYRVGRREPARPIDPVQH